MANPETEKSITGLDQATNRKEAEYDVTYDKAVVDYSDTRGARIE